MRKFLIKLLGGFTEDEVLDRLGMATRAYLESVRKEEESKLFLLLQESISREKNLQEIILKSQGLIRAEENTVHDAGIQKPIQMTATPWTIRKKELERLDIERMQKDKKDYWEGKNAG